MKDPRGRKPNPANITDPHCFARIRTSTRNRIMGILSSVPQRKDPVTVDDVIKAALIATPAEKILSYLDPQ